jgi:hypothetical protein
MITRGEIAVAWRQIGGKWIDGSIRQNRSIAAGVGAELPAGGAQVERQCGMPTKRRCNGVKVLARRVLEVSERQDRDGKACVTRRRGFPFDLANHAVMAACELPADDGVGQLRRARGSG